MGILNKDLNNINLDNDFDGVDSDTIILMIFLGGILNSENAKNLRKS